MSCGSTNDPSDRTEPPEVTELYDAKNCEGCHPRHYEEWSASMHAYASIDPVFLAMNARGQEETNGELGGLCVSCHAPIALRTGLTEDGLNLSDLPPEVQGVTCYACHNVESVDGTHNNPLVFSNDRNLRARIRDPMENTFHESSYSALLDGSTMASADACGACHDIVLPSPPAPAEVALERTYAEWQASVFAPAQAPAPSAVSTCIACHMPFVGSEPIAPGGPDRSRHSHRLPAVDVPITAFPATDDREADDKLAAEQRAELERLLDSTLRFELCVQTLPGETSAVFVTLDNANAGHRFPSGAAADRRAWLELIAYREGDVIYESGIVADDEPVVDSTDPDLWLFRDETFGTEGEPVHMFWEVASYTERTIGAQVTNDPSDPRYYTESHAIRRFPRATADTIPGVPDRVTVRMRLRPIGLDVLDDLVESGHLDQAFRGSVTHDLIPHRRLAATPESGLEGLTQVSMEWSSATLESSLFSKREDFTVRPSRLCVGMPRRGGVPMPSP